MHSDKTYWGIVAFSIIEILIGSVTLIAVLLSLIAGVSAKPPEVLAFILVTSVLSLSLGIGIFKRNLTCYRLLLYFSSTIILSKILIFAKIIVLSGALEAAVPPYLKNIISIAYHGLLLFYFSRPSVKKQFGK